MYCTLIILQSKANGRQQCTDSTITYRIY